jgi:hypothetical protein
MRPGKGWRQVGEDEMRLWGCALVVLATGLIIAGIVAGISALVKSPAHVQPIPAGAAGQADDTICFNFLYGWPNGTVVDQAKPDASPDLRALVNTWEADGGVDGGGLPANSQDIQAILTWCSGHGLPTEGS